MPELLASLARTEHQVMLQGRSAREGPMGIEAIDPEPEPLTTGPAETLGNYLHTLAPTSCAPEPRLEDACDVSLEGFRLEKKCCSKGGA